MADGEKKKRSLALSNHTRNVNIFIGLLNDAASSILVTPQFEKVVNCWEKLETARDIFIEKTEIDIDTDKHGLVFMDTPEMKHQQVMSRYASYLKTQAEVEHVHLTEKAAEDRREEEESRRREEENTRDAENRMREDISGMLSSFPRKQSLNRVLMLSIV